MEDKQCELRLPGGRQLRFSYTKLRLGAVALVLLLAAGCGGTLYFYQQLAAYRGEAQEFAEYQQHKEEQQTKLRQLEQDNEKMLRDMAEISNLEKKLRRSIIHDVDSSKLGENQKNMLDQTTTKSEKQTSSYTGQGGNGPLDANSTMAVLQAQNTNISRMLTETKQSISELLGEVEGSSGAAASFPDQWPTQGGTISSSYGARTGPIDGGYDWHPGIDIAVDFGAPVYATAAGTVEQAGWNGGYGRYVRLAHSNGYTTAYGHMSGLAVSAGQKVAKGEVIGFVGSTGYSTGPHLHYEVLADGQNIDPFYVLRSRH